MRRLQKTIAEIGWTRQVPRLARDAKVVEAFDLMSGGAHDCVLVVEPRSPQGFARSGEPEALDGPELAGIFTSRDFLNRVAAVRGDPQVLTLGQVMTPNPRTLRPRDCVAFAMNWMAMEGFRNVPIVDDIGELLGALTVWDVMRHLGEVFDEIDATPRTTPHWDDISGVVLVDLGGGS